MAVAEPSLAFSAATISVETSPTSVTSSLNSASAGERKIGRPTKWPLLQDRKLAKLYIFTTLPPQDILRVLKAQDPNSAPSQISATKRAGYLLNKQPRWLRPKNRKEMDLRLVGLIGCRTQSIRQNDLAPSSQPDTETKLLDTTPVNSESSTPVQDMLAGVLNPFKSLETSPSPPKNSDQETTTSSSSTTYRNPMPEEELNDPLVTKQDVLHASKELALHIDTMGGVPPALETPDHELNLWTEGVEKKDRRTLSSRFSTSSLKKRLPQYTTSFLKSVAKLIRDSTTEPSTNDQQLVESPSGTGLATLKLPNAVLNLDRYIEKQGICFAGLAVHDSNACWCLEKLYDYGQLWVHRYGLVYNVTDPPNSLCHLDVGFKDIFGNTILHMLAARGSIISVMIEALEQGVDGNAKNEAGQSFFHLLSRQFLGTLINDECELKSMLQMLNDFDIKANDCDLFGRNFFHLLTLRARNTKPNSLWLLGDLETTLPRSRDAFGWIASRSAESTIEDCDDFLTNPRRLGMYLEPEIIATSNPRYHESITVAGGGSQDGSPFSPLSLRLHLMSEDGYSFTHARLLETAALSMGSPDIEDSRGRNGLQCLAEASLTLDIDRNSVPSLDVDGMLSIYSTFQAMPEAEISSSVAIGSVKRKRGEPDPTRQAEQSVRLQRRYVYAESMIIKGVDLNHYDMDGNTVLMAFVMHLRDGEDDRTLSNLLHLLIRRGADLHWRNRQGETALHIAVRLGRKVATKVLLENGTNIHVRTSEGKGVLALGQEHKSLTQKIPAIYASILACMALCIQHGAVPNPTFTQEWEIRDSSLI